MVLLDGSREGEREGLEKGKRKNQAEGSEIVLYIRKPFISTIGMRSAAFSTIQSTNISHRIPLVWRRKKRRNVSGIVRSYRARQGTIRGLVCSRSRLDKNCQKISRIALVGGHLAVNLATNVEPTIGIEKMMENITGWIAQSHSGGSRGKASINNSLPIV